MGIIRLRHSARITQQRGLATGVNRGHPLAKDLHRGLVPWLGMRDLIDGAQWTKYNGTVDDRAAFDVGLGLKFTSGPFVVRSSTIPSSDIYGSMTFECLAKAGTATGVLVSASNSSDTMYAILGWNSTLGFYALRREAGYGSSFTSSDPAGVVSGWHHLAATFRTYDNGGAPTSEEKLYVDGVLVASKTTAWSYLDFSYFDTIALGGLVYASGALPAGAQHGDAPVVNPLIWKRALTSEEVFSRAKSVWSIFEPDAFYLPIQTGGGSSTTTVTVDAGTLSLTGQSVTDTVTAAVSAGTVTLTGQNVALQQQQPVAAGSTSLTGQSIGITITVPISPGTLSLTGSDVTVVPPSGSFSIAVDPGALSLTGQAVTNLVTTPISEGSTSLTGQDVSVTTTVTVDPGSITLTGEVITVSYLGTQTIPIEPGTLSVTGRDVEVSITGGTKGGVGKGKNLTLKQKKKLKAVVSQEWLKAEQTVQELLAERLTHKEPAKVKVEKLTQSQSLLDVIDALKALSKETVTLPEQQAVIKTINKTITEKTVKQVDRTAEIEKRMEAFEKRLVDIEEMVLVALSEIL